MEWASFIHYYFSPAIMSLARTANFFPWNVTYHGIFNPPGMSGECCCLLYLFLLVSHRCRSNWLNSVDRRPTVVLLLLTLCTTRATANLSVDQGHDSQLATISSIAAKDVHPWGSPQCKLGEISVLSVALPSLQIDSS